MKPFFYLVVLISLGISGCGAISRVSENNRTGDSPHPHTFTHKTPAAKQSMKQKKHDRKGRISLSWDAVAGASWYNLYYGPKPGVNKSSKNKITGINATSHTVTGLLPGTVYYFVVTAANEKTESAESCETSGKAVSATDMQDSRY